jgi:hypothetical protein
VLQKGDRMGIQALAIIMGLGSFTLYMAAFFFPEVYRRYDWMWSSVAMLYAVMLWISADSLSWQWLVSQILAVGLVVGFGTQTLRLRRQVAPADQKTPIPRSLKPARRFLQAQLRGMLQGLIQGAIAKFLSLFQPRPKAASSASELVAPACPIELEPSDLPQNPRRRTRAIAPLTNPTEMSIPIERESAEPVSSLVEDFGAIVEEELLEYQPMASPVAVSFPAMQGEVSRTDSLEQDSPKQDLPEQSSLDTAPEPLHPLRQSVAQTIHDAIHTLEMWIDRLSASEELERKG